jgi:O-antigen ligase
MHQLHMAIPKILGAPWGHGAGQSGVSMGYGSGQFIALDNYYILIGLDYGVLGLITFYGMIIAAIVYGAFSLLRANTRLDAETDYLVPLVVMLAEFLVIKWVFGQADSHPIVFMVLGMIVALVGRANATAKAKPERIRTTAPRRRTAPASLTPAREPEMAAFGAEDADSPFAVGRSRAPRPVRT